LLVDNLLNLGLIGAGRWGRRYIHTINKIPDIRLAHVASSNENTRDLVIGDCLISQDWQSLIGDSDLGGLIIATPPSSHFDISMQAIKAKLPP
jgi:predicted dehydrogenase